MANYGSNMKWLHIDGKWIVDGDGNIVILRGANFMGYEFGSWDSHMEEDYARMASWGFNVVRLPIAWHYIEPEPGVYNESYFKNYVDKDIAWAKKYGIYIILDMHQYRWSPHFNFEFSGKQAQGNGMPVWLVSAYSNSPEGLGQAVQDFLLGMGANGTATSETNPSMKERFVAIWKYVASRYANETTLLGYDLLNEPPLPNRFNPQGLNAKEASSYLYPLYEELIHEIRKIDDKHIIFYQPINVQNLKDARLLNYQNVGFSFHYYGYQTNYDGNVTRLENDLVTNFLEYPEYNPVTDWGVPIYVGEFGIDDIAQNSELYVKHILTIFDEYQLMYTWWSYWKSDTYAKSLLRADGSERMPVQYLDRPYPMVLTLPSKWEFDIDKKEFLLNLSEGSHFVQIYVPQRCYINFRVYYDIEVISMETWNSKSRILTLKLVSSKPLMTIIRAV